MVPLLHMQRDGERDFNLMAVSFLFEEKTGRRRTECFF
jgi:hypothetical protein